MDSERLAWFDNICIFLQFAFCDIYVLGLLNVMKQIKQAQPVLDMEKKNHKHEAYLKSIKSSIKIAQRDISFLQEPEVLSQPS